MKKIWLGQSGIAVSQIGLGTVKFGRNQGVKYPAPFELPTDDALQTLLACAEELGVNLLDTAPAYGVSEERLGRLLGKTRSRWVISTKVGEEFAAGQSCFDFSAQAIRQSIERSLRRLNTDYLDIVLVHSNGADVKLIKEYVVFDTLAMLKQAGIIRAFGMSTKTVEGGLLTVDCADVVMVTYNPLQTEERQVISYAAQQKKGVLIKKALASGHLKKMPMDDPVRHAIEFIYREPGVSSIIVGTLNPKHLQHNVACLLERTI